MALDRTGTATPSRIEGFDRAVPVWLIAAGALLLLILLPLGWLAYMSVSGERGLTITHYARVFYVTHDQAEAMVIADRVAVLERGRVAQIGRAEELYEAPSTRFVAEFIGKTNLVEGRAEDADTFTRGRLRIRVDGAVLSPGAPTILSIRPHQIELRPLASDDPARPPLGALRGAVLRASYLGDAVDYQVEIADSDVVLRVAGPAVPRLRAGDAVWLRVLHGRALPQDAEKGPSASLAPSAARST